MGFNKRYINDNQLISWLENKLPLERLFKADALIFEGKISSKVYDLHKKGLTDLEIKNKIKENAI